MKQFMFIFGPLFDLTRSRADRNNISVSSGSLNLTYQTYIQNAALREDTENTTISLIVNTGTFHLQGSILMATDSMWINKP